MGRGRRRAIPLALALAGLALISLALGACQGAPVLDRPVAQPPHRGLVRIGGKDFTEQYLLVKITSLLLKERGYQVEETVNMRTVRLREALLDRHLDLYWEYTGTGLVVLHGRAAIADAEAAHAAIRQLDARVGVTWLNRTGFNNTYTIMMRRDQAERLGIRTVSDLAAYLAARGGDVPVAVDYEFAGRPDGLGALERHYGFQVRPDRVRRMHAGLVYRALEEGRVEVADGFATDGRIAAYGLVNLEDDRRFFPAYHAAPVLREADARAHPDLVAILNQIGPRLDQETMARLNYLVDVEHEEVTRVARRWLAEQGLLRPDGPE